MACDRYGRLPAVTMDGLRGREARFWLWVGRAVLLLTPAVVLALAIARLVSPPAAVSGSEELSWWELAVLGLVLAFAFGAPLILLPVTSATLTSSADCILEAQTVLGRRRLALASVTARSLEMQGEILNWKVNILRDRSGGWLIVIGAEPWELAGGEPAAPGSRGRRLPWYVEWLVILGWIVTGVVIGFVALLAIIP